MCRAASPPPGFLGLEPLDFAYTPARLAEAPLLLTSADMMLIAPGAGERALDLAKALNRAVEDAGITSRIGQAMFIAQCAHETGGFSKDTYEESGVKSIVVFNPDAGVESQSKVKVAITGTLERYLQGKERVSAWRLSREKYLKLQRDYVAKNSGKTLADAPSSEAWKPVALTDYLPGDQELAYWKIWYDPESPFKRRSDLAKKNGNVSPGDGQKYVGRGFIQLTWRNNYREAGEALGLSLENQPEQAANLGVAVRVAAWWWKSRGLNKYSASDSKSNFEAVTKGINGGLVGLTDRQRYFTTSKRVLSIEG